MLTLKSKSCLPSVLGRNFIPDLDQYGACCALRALLGRFVLEPTIVHDLADGRQLLWEISTRSRPSRAMRRGVWSFQDANLLAVATDHADARNADAVVDRYCSAGKGGCRVSGRARSWVLGLVAGGVNLPQQCVDGQYLLCSPLVTRPMRLLQDPNPQRVISRNSGPSCAVSMGL